MAHKRMSNSSKVSTETLAILGCAAAASIAASSTDAFEKLCILTRRFEHLELDEVLPAVVIFGIAFLTLAGRHRNNQERLQSMVALRRDHSEVEQDTSARDSIEELFSMPSDFAIASKNLSHLILITIDPFEAVVAKCGLAGVDDFISLIALRLDAALRMEPSAFLVRRGRDKFFCILPGDVGEQMHEAMAEKLLKAARAPLPGWPALPISASAVVVECMGNEGLAEVMQRAEAIR